MKRSKHKLSYHKLASFDMGQLVPVGLTEVLPGDTFRHRTTALLRVTPLVNPLMHQVTVRIHHWFVPARVAYNQFASESASNDNWEEYWNKKATSASLKSQAVTNIAAGDLMNHLGLPVLNGISMNVNRLPLYGYNMIWNSFYRDVDLHTAVALTNTTLQRCCWEKDYFTACRPNAQYDTSTMNIPFDVHTAAGLDGAIGIYSDAVAAYRRMDSDSTNVEIGASTTNAQTNKMYGGVDINELRRNLALQRYLEARSRYGSRYRDFLRYLGIRPKDGRTDDAEYLGGGKQNVAFSEVISTAEGTTAEVGSLAGHGIAAVRTRPYTRFFEEHGYIYTLISCRPRTMYQESMEKHWFRDTRDDFWQKEYEAFGAQPVLKKEVYAAHANETDVFGYQDRFNEYRSHPSLVSGLFGSTDDDWHMAREFGGSTSLNGSFVTCTPTDRAYADTNDSECRVMVAHSMVARRLVSKRAR